MRKECIRKVHRASCDQQGTVGSLVPIEELDNGMGALDRSTYIFRFGLTLEIGLDGLVLLIKLGEIRN